MAGEWVRFLELFMDAHFHRAKKKLLVPAATELLNWKKKTKSPEVSNPLPGGMTPPK